MVEGKPYRYGLIVAGLCMTAVGLFIMTQERPHIYGTMCGLGVIMVCLGTVWSLCQCYPKVILAPGIQEESLEDLEFTAAAAKHERTLSDRHVVGEHGDSSSSVMCLKGGKVSTNTQHAEALPGFCGQKSSNSRLLPEALKSQCHSCPTLQLV